MAEEVKLIGMWASPYSSRIKLALKMKGIMHEYVEEDLSNKSDLLLNSNPIYKKTPVLLHNQLPIAESLVILEYIDEIWPNNPFLPHHPYQRSIARFWANFIDEKMMQTAISKSRAREEDRKQHNEELHQQLKLVENQLKENEYFGGESVGYLDIVAFSILYWFQTHHEIKQTEFISEDKYPVLHKWMGKMEEMDLVKESLPPRDKFLSFLKARMEA